jgi:hypothetical protein
MPWALYLPSAELANAIRSDLENPQKVQILEANEWALPVHKAPRLVPQNFATSTTAFASGTSSDAR